MDVTLRLLLKELNCSKKTLCFFKKINPELIIVISLTEFMGIFLKHLVGACTDQEVSTLYTIQKKQSEDTNPNVLVC